MSSRPRAGRAKRVCLSVLARSSASSESPADPFVAKKQKEEDKAKRDANDRDITDFFTKGAANSQPKPKASWPLVRVLRLSANRGWAYRQ